MDMTIAIAQVLLPFGLLFWQGISPAKSQIGWILKTHLVLGYLFIIAQAGLWLSIFTHPCPETWHHYGCVRWRSSTNHFF